MARFVLVLVLVAGAAAAAWKWWPRTPAPPAPGVPRAMAEDRARRIHDLRYDVKIAIPASRQAAVGGRVIATFTLADVDAPLALDFAQPSDKLHAVRVNDTTLTPEVVQGHVVLPARTLVRGPNTVEIAFTAGDAPLNRNDEFMYSIFVPARASLAMPVFDQPDLKARWKLALDVPPQWTAVANGRQAGRVETPASVSLIFEETAPLPTYLFSFTAGRFEVETAVRGGREFRMLHRETDAAKVARNRDAIFDLHAAALAWLEEYTGIPYAFGKFDFVLIPSFQFGGMEHAGAITYNASGLLLDESATQNQRLGRANLIAHETAHMWFGDLVTMTWFNDVWMKEVFANLMAAKIVNPSFPDVNHDLRFLLQNYPAAYGVDRTDGANPIRQDLANLSEAGSLYGAIIYQKAPIVMRQLEQLMGATAFRDGLRQYLRAHQFGNASWSDLVTTMDALTPMDVAAWSRAWVDEPGRPVVRTDLEVTGGRIARLAFVQSDTRGRGLVWPQKIRVAIGGPSAASRTADVTIAGVTTEVPEAVGLPAPAWVLPVGGGLGYGRFDMDPATLEFLTTRLHEIDDPLLRGASFTALWESMVEGHVPPARVMQLVIAALPRERDELNVQNLLDAARTTYWRYTAADDRAAMAVRLEPLLRAGLDRAATTSVKAAWFGAIRGVATSPATVAWLEQVWRRDVKIPGLPLSETDESELALDLAVRDVTNAEQILETQRGRITNADRKARFAFVMPALARDAAGREKFFESLQDPANRQREAWVLEAVRYLHHPLRGASSRRLVRPALEMVREIQQTGDIFFPKRWADATLSGYQAVQTAADVRAFIEELPSDYPHRLRWVLLSSADPLFRAAKILQ